MNSNWLKSLAVPLLKDGINHEAWIHLEDALLESDDKECKAIRNAAEWHGNSRWYLPPDFKY